jgi:sulfite reductase (NADPH) flavoprotein alpha-component
MIQTATIRVPVIPASAPFTAAQIAWLNGYFAGLFSAAPMTGEGNAQPMLEAAPPAAQEDETMPWHDPAMPMDERLIAAAGKPKARILMAAMAQLDCGACGYLCQTYAEAIASGDEKDLTRCAPGGKETSRKLKQLLVELSVGGQRVVEPVARTNRTANREAKAGHDRANPFPARLLKSQPLNKPGSSKDTRFIAFDLKGSGLTYNVGDSLGVFPQNCPDSVQWILERIDASGAEEVTAPDSSKVNLMDALQKHFQITTPTESLIELLASKATDAAHAQALNAMLAEDGTGIPEGHEIVDLLTQYPSARPTISEFLAVLRPLQPRLYSISSSQRAHPDEVHLTVGVVRYANARQRQCKGVASTFLAERLRPGQKVRVFVQQSHGFHVPAHGDTPMIMVGPGTGVAPFRAFLEERKATQARGRNWLFFGDQRGDFDFLYQDELDGHLHSGLLTHLDTAFSRDQSEKIYVQHRMLQRGREIWDWLKAGAHFYVCGDAKKMALDVDNALRQIVSEQGGMTLDAAKAFLASLTKEKRYQRDVY